jgi:aryl-alcohol dehydrogenase-like predicted oxidoreductase
MKIVLGTWPISGDYGKYNVSQAKKLINYFLSKGNNEFDTAPNYGFGKSELILGQVLFNKKVLINTKIGNNEKKQKSFNLNFLKNSFENSLKRLKRKSINVLFLHNPRNIKNSNKVFEFLKDLKKKNKIKNYGISISKDFKYSKKFLNKFKIFQLDYNLIYQKLYFDEFYRSKSNIYIRSPLASGLLVGKKKIFSKNDHRSEWLTKKRVKNIYNSIDEIKKSKKYNIKKFSILFLKKSEFSKKVIFGCRTISQFKNIEKIINSKHQMTDEEFSNVKKDYLKKIKNKKLY